MINWHIRPMALMVKGAQPYDPALFAKNAAMLDQMARILPESYQPGSDVGDTRAKPEIWKEPEKFKQAMDRLHGETAKLAEVSKGGNLEPGPHAVRRSHQGVRRLPRRLPQQVTAGYQRGKGRFCGLFFVTT